MEVCPNGPDHPGKPSQCRHVTHDIRELRYDSGPHVELVIYYTALSHWMTFFVLEVTSWDSNGGHYGGHSTIDDPDEADPILAGHVKWDGCCEFQMGLGNSAIADKAHFCGYQHASIIHRAITAVYELASKTVEAWSAYDADYPEEKT